MQDILCMILGGGRGTRLYPLTKLRSKPAVPVAGKYRLIDIPISNCINSGLNRIYVLTQYLSVSLHRHIANTYKFDPFDRGFVEVLAAQQTEESTDWYQGTADAVRQQIRYVVEDPCKEIMILSGDQLYRIDFADVIRTHRDHRADATIAVMPAPEAQVSGLGIMKVNDTGRVTGFVEKPQTPELLKNVFTPAEWMQRRGVASNGRNYLASMGIYLFRKEALLDLLNAPNLAKDFGREVFPQALSTHHVQAHLFDGYWEDLGTIKAYHEASLALAGCNPPFDFHTPHGVIYTRMRFLPASRIAAASLTDCLISDGCVIEPGTSIERSIIGVRSRIGKNVQLRDTIVIGADRYETDDERNANARNGVPNLIIGDNTIIEGAILDKDCRIGSNVKIVNHTKMPDDEKPNYVIRDGIIVIPRGQIIPDGTEI
jgi:glucose-1-phosphate adenylyltransferase